MRSRMWVVEGRMGRGRWGADVCVGVYVAACARLSGESSSPVSIVSESDGRADEVEVDRSAFFSITNQMMSG